MGFGVMFFGVFFFASANVNGFDVLPDFVGYIIILYGIKCATRYCGNFKTARVAGYIGLAAAVALFGVQGVELLGANVPTTLVGAVETANSAAKIVFLMILLFAVFGLAKETGAEKTQRRSLMSLIVVPVFWLGNIAGGVINYAGIVSDGDTLKKILTAALVCEIVYVIVAAIGVFSAYMWICVEGDEDMPKRNNSKSPMDYFDRRRERERDERERIDAERKKAAEAAGKSVAEMYGVKKKKKK